jgi:hypothetical protein
MIQPKKRLALEAAPKTMPFAASGSSPGGASGNPARLASPDLRTDR